MEFKLSYPVLQGNHVRLEPICEAHTDGLLEIGQEAGDWQYLPISGYNNLEHAREWVSEALRLAACQEALPYVICDAATGKPLGSTRFMMIRPKHHALEIGYTWLGKEAQRSPVNTETKYLLLRHAFESMGAYRVELKTDARNHRSQAAIERIGGIREGVLRRHMIAQGGHHRDTIMYSITNLEWPEVSERLQGFLTR